jgi:hypothetical protein
MMVVPGDGSALVAWPAWFGWVVAVEVEVEVEVEPEPPVVDDDDPPHAVSSSTSDPSPAAAAHPLLRITSLHSQVLR